MRTYHKIRKGKRLISRLLIYLLLFVGGIVMIFPFAWMVRSSLLPYGQVFRLPPIWIPNPPRFENYWEALTVLPFARYFINTAIIVALAVSGTVLTGSLSAFAFSRLEWPGRDIIFVAIIATLMLPYAAIMIPTFILWKTLGLVNTYTPLTLPWWCGGGAFNIFLMRQFFRGIPTALDEAAYVDGAKCFQVYSRIILPLSKPVLIVVFLFSFMFHWNDFLAPLLYLSDPEKYTLAIGLASFFGTYWGYWHHVMAASTVTVIPVLILFFIGQRYFMRGIILSGIKA